MGHGMKQLCIDMLSKWGEGTIILSPVNINQMKLEEYAHEFRKRNAKILFDPQLFFPKDAHEKLKNYDYWPLENSTLTDKDTLDLINNEILKINLKVSSDRIILPSIQINEENFAKVMSHLQRSIKFFRDRSEKKILVTIALYPESIRNHEFIEHIINTYSKIDVDGYYVVPQPPNSEYIVSDGSWTIGILKLLTALKFTKREVIVGYSNHQALMYALANVDAIASGNYMNTRAFSPMKFKSTKEGIKQKSTWIYVPNTLSEYKVTQLDIAKQRNILELFEPSGMYANSDIDMLFSGATPSSTNYSETNSFRHYLHCLKVQCDDMKENTYDLTYTKYEFLLSNAEKNLKDIKKYGLTGHNRNFEDGIEANRIAMIACRHDYGLKMMFEWM